MLKAGFIVTRVSFLVLAASMLGVAMLAAPAAGQANTCSPTTKCFFSVSVSPGAGTKPPSNPTAGVSNSFTFTIENNASPQRLGAVQISAPTGFMITSASIAPGASGTASSTSSSAQFLNLSLAPSSIATLTVIATVSCSSGSYQWPIAAKQSNNFNGSGNNFQIDPQSVPNLSGTATGSCTQSPPCPPSSSCSASASSATTGDSVTVTTSSPVPPGDFIVAGIEDTSVNYSCPTYKSTSEVFSFAVFDAKGVPQSIALIVTVRIDKSVVNMSGHPGASSWQICYASTTPFNAVPGTFTPATDPNAPTIGGISYNTGLLLDCPSSPGTPCVQSRNKNNAGDVIVTFLAFGDPFAHG
jgi:hypothetical protein